MVMEREDISRYLQDKYHFVGNTHYLTKDAPGHLGYWVSVLIDIRFKEDFTIKGVRGTETEQLFRGNFIDKTSLDVILKSVKVI